MVIDETSILGYSKKQKGIYAKSSFIFLFFTSQIKSFNIGVIENKIRKIQINQ